MRELLLAATLLYSVIAEFEGEKSYRSASNVETQSWPKKFRRLPWENIDHNFLPSTMVVNRSGIDSADIRDLRKVTRYRSSIMQKLPIVIIMYEYQESIDDRLGSGRIRRENHGWTVQEPFYVEEPSWIVIENNEKLLGKMSEENDPFFVTRGKKVFGVKEREDAEVTKKNYNNVQSPKYFPEANEGTRNAIKMLEKGSEEFWNLKMNFPAEELKENEKYGDFLKNVLKDLEKLLDQENFKESQENLGSKNLEGRSSISSKISLAKTDAQEKYPRRPAGHLEDGVNNVLEKERRKRDLRDFSNEKKDFEKRTDYKLENEDMRELIKNAILEQGHRVNLKDLSFLQPRNKHSNILDIFDEPFFISRGKKKNENYPEIWKNNRDLSKDIVSGEVTDEFGKSASRSGYPLKIFENWKFCQNPRDKRSKAKPPRNRRGMLDEILTRFDPFYVARGKRISPRVSKKSWERGIFEKQHKITNMDIDKFLENGSVNWLNANPKRNDLEAWKESQQTSSIMKNNVLEDNEVRNSDNWNNFPTDGANGITIKKNMAVSRIDKVMNNLKK